MITLNGRPMLKFTIRLEIEYKDGLKRMQTFEVNSFNRDAAEQTVLRNHVSADESDRAKTIRLVLVNFTHA